MSLSLLTHYIPRIISIQWNVYKKIAFSRLTNVLVWSLSWLTINSYFLPLVHPGTDIDYHTRFMFAGLAAAIGYFELYGFIVDVVSDLEHDRTFESYALLPSNIYTTLFCRFVIYPSLIVFFITCEYLVIANLFLHNIGILKALLSFKTVILMLTSSFCIGGFSIFVSTFVKSRNHLSNVWTRFIFPLWFFGCFHFSWECLHKFSPFGAYANLLNPIMYSMEGWRSIIFNSESYFSWYACSGILFFFGILFSFFGIKRFIDLVDTWT